jgi:hypothetical protein
MRDSALTRSLDTILVTAGALLVLAVAIVATAFAPVFDPPDGRPAPPAAPDRN